MHGPAINDKCCGGAKIGVMLAGWLARGKKGFYYTRRRSYRPSFFSHCSCLHAAMANC